jgi:FkbM family methyltransferase
MKNKISGKLKRIIKTITSLIGTGILSNKITTNWANFIYNSQGKRFRNFFVEYFDNSKITTLFHWKVPVSISEGREEFILPVLPENQITWNIALSLLWAETGIANLCQIYIYKSQANKVFFDVGSNFGIRSYPFLTAGYDCVLFEPQDFCNQYVLKVAEINNFNLKIEQAVLSDKDEFIDFYVSKSTWFSSLSKEAVELHEQSEKIKVQSILLDNYCEKYKIFPSIVKIDVEGFEWQVLQGAKKLIEERTPTLIIEIWHNNPSKSDIFNYLIQQNYQIFSINQEYLIPINTLSSFMACNQPDYAFICDQWIIKYINIKST